MSLDSVFKQQVQKVVVAIPKGYVMTYGQIAAVCGHVGAARVIGQIAHYGDVEVPWHRVVNAKGMMASGFWPDGPSGQKRLLESEGIVFDGDKLNLGTYLWTPPIK